MRQYLGNWLTESTADVYTREKRNVVCSIWEKFAKGLSHARWMVPAWSEKIWPTNWDDKVLVLDDALLAEGPESPVSSAGIPRLWRLRDPVVRLRRLEK